MKMTFVNDVLVREAEQAKDTDCYYIISMQNSTSSNAVSFPAA